VSSLSFLDKEERRYERWRGSSSRGVLSRGLRESDTSVPRGGSDVPSTTASAEGTADVAGERGPLGRPISEFVRSAVCL